MESVSNFVIDFKGESLPVFMNTVTLAGLVKEVLASLIKAHKDCGLRQGGWYWNYRRNGLNFDIPRKDKMALNVAVHVSWEDIGKACPIFDDMTIPDSWTPAQKLEFQKVVMRRIWEECKK